VNEPGISSQKVRSLTGFTRVHAFRLKKRYFAEGIGSLTDKRLGSPKELLTKKQREEIMNTLKTKTPKNFGYATEFWTTSLLGAYIERKYSAKYKSRTSYYLLFKKAEFTYHKPERVYHEQDADEVEQWKKTATSKLKKLFSEPDTVILAADEMILTTRTTIQKIWLPKGEYPKIEASNGTVQRRNVYGFLNIRTGAEHAYKTDKQNMRVTKTILGRIRLKYPTQKIALLWDNAGWHKGSAVAEYIKQDGSIVVIPFPRYAPEENPQEHVWKSGRANVTHNRFIEDIDRATDEFVAWLRKTKFPYSLLGFGNIS
jgi:transposase